MQGSQPLISSPVLNNVSLKLILSYLSRFISSNAIFLFVFRLRTPISHAVYNADDELLEFLVCRCKADVHAELQDSSGVLASLLHVAVEQGHEKMIRSLKIDFDLDINELDSLYRNSTIANSVFWCYSERAFSSFLLQNAEII